MPRSSEAYLVDIIESCDTIEFALAGIDVEGYLSNRVIRSAVEREFIIIGEAVASHSTTCLSFAMSAECCSR